MLTFIASVYKFFFAITDLTIRIDTLIRSAI